MSAKNKNLAELTEDATALGIKVTPEMTKREIQDAIDLVNTPVTEVKSIFEDPKQADEDSVEETELPDMNANDLIRSQTPPVPTPAPEPPVVPVTAKKEIYNEVDPFSPAAKSGAEIIKLASRGMNATLDELEKQEKATILIPYEKDDKPDAKKKMIINGVKMELPKGRLIQVPIAVAQQYMNNYNQKTFAGALAEQKAKQF